MSICYVPIRTTDHATYHAFASHYYSWYTVRTFRLLTLGDLPPLLRYLQPKNKPTSPVKNVVAFLRILRECTESTLLTPTKSCSHPCRR